MFFLIIASNISFIEDSSWEQNLTPARFGAMVVGDINNDGNLDIISTGCLFDGANDCEGGVIAKIYLNNGTTFNENLTWEQNLTGVGLSSLALGDIDNDGDLDLALTGCDSSTNFNCYGNFVGKIYINNGTSFVENQIWQQHLSAVTEGSFAFGDINNDGKLDLAQIGANVTPPYLMAKIYINNGSSLVESSQWQSNLTGVQRGNIAFGDIDNDGYLDLVLSGYKGTVTEVTEIYINNGTSLIKNSQWGDNLIPEGESSVLFGDYNNDEYLDLLTCGHTTGDHCYLYKNNGSSLLLNQTRDTGLPAIYSASIAFGDIDNDGDLDFIGMGWESGRTMICENNETNNYYFQNDATAHLDIPDDLYMGSLAFGDYDHDYDLDLITSGAIFSSGLLVSKVYISNASLTKNNTLPIPPSIFTSHYSTTDNTLILTWNNSSDNETPSTGLYYNLMVGNFTQNNTIVSGVYGGESGSNEGGGGGANGYFGNMMQRKNITLNLVLPEGTYYWYVQTIDTGLAKSNWSDRQSFTVSADTTPPNISSIGSSVTTTTATITWTTDEMANSSVYYGTTTSTTSGSVDVSLTQAHSITLNSLSASTLYYYNVSSCDDSSNCNTSIQYSFTTSAVTASPSGGGSSGGGGGIIITNKSANQTLAKFDIDFSNSSSGSLEAKQGDIKTFSFQGEIKHSITVMTITSNSITLLITSEPITIQIKFGETKQIDINKDNIDDFEIKLDSIIFGKARFSLTKLSGADIVGKEEIEESIRKEALFDAKISISNLFQVVKSGREVIAKIEVFNVNNIGQVDVKVDYYITDKDNKTIAQGSDTLAVEAVASFVRSLTVPYNTKAGVYYFNVDVKYKDNVMASGHAEFRVMRTYEIIVVFGIIVLIVVGIFFYLWMIRRKEKKDVALLKKKEEKDIWILKKKENKLEKEIRMLKDKGRKRK